MLIMDDLQFQQKCRMRTQVINKLWIKICLTTNLPIALMMWELEATHDVGQKQHEKWTNQ